MFLCHTYYYDIKIFKIMLYIYIEYEYFNR
jgi:hypothetical protein